MYVVMDENYNEINYENSTDQGTDVVINEETVPSPANGWMDYVHPNSLDYTLDTEGNVDKLLVSMRDAGSRPVFTEYDMANDQITFERNSRAVAFTEAGRQFEKDLIPIANQLQAAPKHAIEI